MPPEENPTSDKKETSFGKKALIGIFNSFRNRPDSPKYTYEEQNKMGEELLAISERLKTDKTPENQSALAVLSEKIKESKADKKHTSAIMAPILSAKHFLEEAKNNEWIPEETRNDLAKKADELFERLGQAQVVGNISDELVADTLKLMDELEIYLK